MDKEQLDNNELWRAIIFFGKNETTYKLALGQSLASFVKAGRTWIELHELAEMFFNLYSSRIENGRAQIRTVHRQTTMENILAEYSNGRITRETAIQRVEKKAFGDVLARFHTLNDSPIQLLFYERQLGGLVLTDDIFKIFNASQEQDLLEELETKWTLLELGFQQRRTPNEIQVYNDLKQFYLQNKGKRTNLTRLAPLLKGCQNGKCFYCGEDLGTEHTVVDHFIPFQIIRHNEVWNLVVAHKLCNDLKSDRIADQKYFHKLFLRNEDIINAKSPLEIESQLLRDLGRKSSLRYAKMYQQYEDARSIVREAWTLRPGYDPETDPFFRKVIRTMYL
jgi:5-methylcytosine-specific restriction endonuclease McrA